MRLLVVFLYIGFLFIMTCTASFTDLIEHQQIRFLVTDQPDFWSFFEYRSFPYSDPGYISQKAGHALCFFMLAVLLKTLFHSFKAVITVSWVFALITEIAQMYFSRTGCLVDVMYDSGGIMLFLMVHYLSRAAARSTDIFDT
ncbi:VanZ family protein [Bacillus salacetis]|uniref:VanZ family protein n=1 Tax=Bacillus salacetis TaxID=2315464 RepID=A0A3A1QUM4_9BACI|nr:VanZ family protein [Bacillus salacetis]RIW31857.1 VanZ family protein [Bacillus salacetis]